MIGTLTALQWFIYDAVKVNYHFFALSSRSLLLFVYPVNFIFNMSVLHLLGCIENMTTFFLCYSSIQSDYSIYLRKELSLKYVFCSGNPTYAQTASSRDARIYAKAIRSPVCCEIRINW